MDIYEQNIDTIFQVVVKPSGVMWHGSQGVSFHDTKDKEGISCKILDLLSQLEPHDGVLVELFVAPPTTGKKYGQNKNHPNRKFKNE